MRTIILGSLCVAALVCAPAAFADHHEKAEGEGMSPEAMQEYMQKYAMPGPEHKYFEFYKGEWKSKQKMWMEPGQDPMVSEGTASFTPSLDGRYVVGNYTGTFMGQPFKGMDISGYDRVEKRHFNIWFDTAGTGYLVSHGHVSEDGKTLTLTGSMKDPMSSKMMNHRMIMKRTGDDSFTFEMFQALEGMDESKSLEIVYTRTKKSAAK